MRRKCVQFQIFWRVGGCWEIGSCCILTGWCKLMQDRCKTDVCLFTHDPCYVRLLTEYKNMENFFVMKRICYTKQRLCVRKLENEPDVLSCWTYLFRLVTHRISLFLNVFHLKAATNDHGIIIDAKTECNSSTIREGLQGQQTVRQQYPR